MSAAAQTRIFGLRIGVNPKILVGSLFALVVILFWWNSRSDDETGPPPAATVAHQATPTAPLAARPRVPIRRAAGNNNDRGTLRLRPIDATQGDVDPTLRLDLLARLQSVQPGGNGRNLFEVGPAALTAGGQPLTAHAPILHPQPLPVRPYQNQPGAPGAAVVNIPLKYYGFVKGAANGQGNRGLFLDGDNVLVGTEGEVLKQRYMVVELTPNSARLEDVQMRQGQTLPVVPVALP